MISGAVYSYLPPAIVVVVRLGPHVRKAVVFVIIPVFVKAQDIELFIVNRTRFL